MTFGERVRENPIRALVWIEAVAAVLALCADAATVLLDPAAAAINRHVYPYTAVVAAIALAAIFAIPHAPNRRFIPVAVACAGVAAIGWFPPDGVLLFILAAILTARLTFAWGFRGAVTGWIVACASLALRVYSATSGPDHAGTAGSTPQSVLTYVTVIGPTALLLALVFGVIGMMRVYAERSADAAAASERTRIALDLHDFLGHGLTTLRVQLQNAERYRTADPAKAEDYIRRALARSGELLADVRETVGLLHDDAEQVTPSFSILFERLCSDFSATHPILVERGLDVPADPTGRIAIALYRTIQEALTNVARHAGAQHVWVRVRGDDRRIEASVEDDGCGIEGGASDGGGSRRGHGLTSMRERIVGVGGEFAIAVRQGGGTLVRATVPVEAAR